MLCYVPCLCSFTNFSKRCMVCCVSLLCVSLQKGKNVKKTTCCAKQKSTTATGLTGLHARNWGQSTNKWLSVGWFVFSVAKQLSLKQTTGLTYRLLYHGLHTQKQDVHRGVIDRTLAKEAGLVPRLRCVGVMTTGDFFGPEAMTDQRASGRGRGPRVVPSGSYRIRSVFFFVCVVDIWMLLWCIFDVLVLLIFWCFVTFVTFRCFDVWDVLIFVMALVCWCFDVLVFWCIDIFIYDMFKFW